ncbi:nucleotidyltransferase-like protein [uncultured Rummeliibacillus sp.]|uniref:nucleotidyltransferase-like protein n=1 Tax=uncultured Rummeliibacillus sp. TaxID=762292 RepID=UPI00262BD36B|nr:nucleotidyltransferase-like protein [uncultured Rummeliibacillus sp.]
MEQLLRPIYQERASQPNTLGIIIVEKREDVSPITDTFDTVLLIVTKENKVPVYTKHYTYENKKAAMHIITEKQLHKWLLVGTNKKLIDWILFGKIVFDRNEYISDLKQNLKDFPFYGRNIKMGIEFAKLIRHYLEGKVCFEETNFLDAYNHVVESLHHLARLAILDKGLYPEVTVWSQVKQIDPEIYKLYEELITSEESIEKRLELLFLASEFLIHSRTADGARHIISVMSKKEYWTIQELHEQEELKNYSVDLEVFVEFLISKGYIFVEKVETKGNRIFHRYYKIEQTTI